jgi:hypothetical protein
MRQLVDNSVGPTRRRRASSIRLAALTLAVSAVCLGTTPAPANPDPGTSPLAGLVLIDDLAILPEDPGTVSVDSARHQTIPLMGAQTFRPFGAIRARLEPWEDGVLPIAFGFSVSPERRQLFLEACAEWSKLADVRCQVGPYRNRELRVGAYTSGCWGLYGMGSFAPGLRRTINLSENCWSRQTVIHEIGHALGLIHEHQRPDRDRYVEIRRENLDQDFLGLMWSINFDDQPVELSTPYDFLSIMHYGRRAFSRNGKDTLVPRAPYAEFADRMGRVKLPSTLDGEALARIYGPPRAPANP